MGTDSIIGSKEFYCISGKRERDGCGNKATGRHNPG